jgi:asparagine synthase (glutamine-hydrolysing)
MCGIFAILQRTKSVDYKIIVKSFESIEYRGPDDSELVNFGNENYLFGFHRLSINDLSVNGNQPFIQDNIILLCNGEIYNHKNLESEYDLNCNSQSDCEVILHLYKKIGMRKTIELLDGVFAFILYDKNANKLYLGRDRVGVRPLFYRIDEDKNIAICSEVKGITHIGFGEVNELMGSHLLEVDNESIQLHNYYKFPLLPIEFEEDSICNTIREKLEKAVEKRLMSDREIGCLLSGGVDSSIIASVLAKFYKKLGKRVKTFSIGFNESTDIKYAREVAKYIDSDHYEVIINYDEAISRIPEVIQRIETYDITTIRASVGMYLLAEYISKNFKEKVIFSGEGSDEILAGYLYFHYAPSEQDLFNECRKRVLELPKYDVLRADRCTASHGLELRVPFLDRNFIHYCMSLDGKYRKPKDGIEKYYLRKAFTGYIPDNVLWRRKEGFSDGVSGLNKPWYVYIQEYIEENNLVDEQELEIFNKVYNNKFISKESLYYYKEFMKHYSHKPIPGYWMPNWSNAKDPSGRVLSVFDEK